jgi:hypothetical protein
LSGVGNTALQAVNGTVHFFRAVLQSQHVIKRIFQPFGLLGNINSTGVKCRQTDYVAAMVMKGDRIGVVGSIQLPCSASWQFCLVQVIKKRIYWIDVDISGIFMQTMQ